MMTLDYTAIVLAVLMMMSGWVTYWGLRADNRQKEMDLSKDYVSEWRTYIAEPLQREVGELRNEVAQLRHAIELVSDCPHRDACPVRAELQRTAKAEV